MFSLDGFFRSNLKLVFQIEENLLDLETILKLVFQIDGFLLDLETEF